VEDDDHVRAHVERLLDGLGYRVVSARSGAEALERLNGDTGIALLFSDVVMPGAIDGIELAARATAIRPGLPVLLTSGYPESALAGRRAGATLPELLMKPYRRGDLARRVRMALDRR
jgi:CheY-like chemotaxis protein